MTSVWTDASEGVILIFHSFIAWNCLWSLPQSQTRTCMVFVTMCMYLCLYYHCVIHYMRSYCIIIGLAAIERYIRFQSQNYDVGGTVDSRTYLCLDHCSTVVQNPHFKEFIIYRGVSYYSFVVLINIGNGDFSRRHIMPLLRQENAQASQINFI